MKKKIKIDLKFLPLHDKLGQKKVKRINDKFNFIYVKFAIPIFHLNNVANSWKHETRNLR